MLNNDEEYRNIKKEQQLIYEGNPTVVHLADQDIDEETLKDSTIRDYYKYYCLSMREHNIIEEKMYLRSFADCLKLMKKLEEV